MTGGQCSLSAVAKVAAKCASADFCCPLWPVARRRLNRTASIALTVATCRTWIRQPLERLWQCCEESAFECRLMGCMQLCYCSRLALEALLHWSDKQRNSRAEAMSAQPIEATCKRSSVEQRMRNCPLIPSVSPLLALHLSHHASPESGEACRWQRCCRCCEPIQSATTKRTTVGKAQSRCS